MLDFIAKHEASLPAELSTFARAIKDEDVAALATVEGLVKCGRAYAESDEGYKFTEVVRQLNAIVPIPTTAWDLNDESRLLLQDAAKVGVLVGLMAAEWIAWGTSATQQGNVRERARSGGVVLGMMAGYLVMIGGLAELLKFSIRRTGTSLSPGAGRPRDHSD